MKKSILLLLAFVTTSCVNGYSRYYTQYVNEVFPQTENVEVITVSADQYEEAGKKLISQNYIAIGESSFNGEYQGPTNAINQAKKIGAEKVLIASNYTDQQYFTVNGILTSKRRFDQRAVYFVKNPEKLRFGFYYELLSTDDMTKNGINYGLKVSIVINNSPVFDAGIVPGDILLELNGKKLFNLEDINRNATETNIFKFLRNNKEFKATINIRN